MLRVGNRETLNLKGLVRKLTEVSHGLTGDWTRTQEWTFDKSGKPTSYRFSAPGSSEYVHDFEAASKLFATERHTHADGSRTEVEPVHTQVWELSAERHASFSAWGASVAETRFDSRGTPVQTTFRDNAGNEKSIVRYRCDDAGRILEGVQSGEITNRPESASVTGSQRAGLTEGIQRLGSGPEWCRLVFERDPVGRVHTVSTYTFGRLSFRMRYEYNREGDIILQQTNDEEPTQFEYVYDGWRNWTRRISRGPQAGGWDERTIVYHELGNSKLETPETQD